MDEAALWKRLLGHAWRWNPFLYHALVSAQAWGAQLAEGQGKASLTAGRAPAEEWHQLRSKFLEPHRALLVDLLRRTMTEDPEDAPKDEPTPWEQDPRPDMAEDHEFWVAVLTTAWHQDDRGPFWALCNSRGCGAKLRRDREGRLQVVMGNMAYATWDELRSDFLGPHKDAITGILLRGSLGTEAPPAETARVAERFEAEERAKQQSLAL